MNPDLFSPKKTDGVGSE